MTEELPLTHWSNLNNCYSRLVYQPWSQNITLQKKDVDSAPVGILVHYLGTTKKEQTMSFKITKKEVEVQKPPHRVVIEMSQEEAGLLRHMLDYYAADVAAAAT